MTKSNQILDVSYGTFSCRLEGFEDSVETMKTVVSYFHDLAGHDRFMDVEPQAPDMETLALLTAEQADTDVEIAGEGQNVSLRVASDDEDAFDDEDEVVAENIATEDEDTIDDFEDNIEDEEPIRLTDEDDAKDAFDDEDFTNITYEEDEFVEDLEEETAQLQSRDEDVTADEDDAEEEESIAAKLQRIRAVVGRGHVQAPVAETPEDTSELDEEDEDEEEAPVNPLAQRLADLAKRNADLAAADAAEEEAQADEVEDDFETAEFEDDEEAFEDAIDEEDSTGPLVLTAATDDEDEAEDEFADEDHFDLKAEVEDVAREIEERDAQTTKREELPEPPESSMSRILSQTDERLNEPEGRRHRDAFAQLKAAVAATEAARQLGDAGPADEKSDAFREDLGAHEAEIKSEAREPAPLRLVPSQRSTDADKPVDAAAERLRKIASKKETSTATNSGGFAAFAKKQGVTELGDLLEAAAAYIAFVEGDDDFSRPQVMKKVQSATSQEISREDGLRSFGRLLRQSKIHKLNNGRFQVSENTRFRPDGTSA
ncbi:hypothetical protein CLV80_104277 [Yoonia maritima]|uniref:Uncharacterized protein n=2 Tax=Yoonia maritima TaxID=1435347 RepID=A0A2T0W0M1_9RHOB|nr:hypothetical protein CLV80_104277 [Yoonia maritima]